MVISGFLLPRYYHKHHVIATFIVFLLPQTPRLLPRYHQKRQEIACFQPSGKVISTIGQVHPRLCPTLPKALGTCARNYRLIVLMFSVIRAHVRGHKSSCTWAQVIPISPNWEILHACVQNLTWPHLQIVNACVHKNRRLSRT